MYLAGALMPALLCFIFTAEFYVAQPPVADPYNDLIPSNTDSDERPKYDDSTIPHEVEKVIIRRILDIKNGETNKTIQEYNDDIVVTTTVESVVGRSAALPCNIQTEKSENRVYMILWFGQGRSKPLYSYDVRGRSLSTALHWADENFIKRAFFNTSMKPAALVIERLLEGDDGDYRCRVDYKNSPTRNYQIRLKLTTPPYEINLVTSRGEIIPGVLGPIKEGAKIHVMCLVRGGNPQPTVRWVVNNETLTNAVVLNTTKDSVLSRVLYRNVPRSWASSLMVCQAINSNVVAPYERTAVIDMILKPLSIEIQGKPTTRVMEKIPIILTCISRGSRPPVILKWMQNNRVTQKFITNESIYNDTMSLMTIILYPTSEDNGSTMKCVAAQKSTYTVLEDSFQLEVLYLPVVNVQLGNNLDPNNVREGDDAYFTCAYYANPPATDIFWYYNGAILHHNVSAGVTISSDKKSLILHKVTRHFQGVYTCKVKSPLGETLGRVKYLRVLYSPRSRMRKVYHVGADINENIYIRCIVKGDPMNISFSWLFSNGVHSFIIEEARYKNFIMGNSVVSQLQYMASSKRDYGVLRISTSNIIGNQNSSCQFKITPNDPPNPVKFCIVPKNDKKNEDMLRIKCFPGQDPSLFRYYTLVALKDGFTERIIYNNSREIQHFAVWLNMSWSRLDSLKEDEELAVVGWTRKGKSKPYILKNQNNFRKMKNKSVKNEKAVVIVKAPMNHYTITAIAVTVFCILAALTIVSLYFLRRWRNAQGPAAAPVVADSPEPSDDDEAYGFVVPNRIPKPKPDILNAERPIDNRNALLIHESTNNRRTYTIHEVDEDGSPQPVKQVVEVQRHQPPRCHIDPQPAQYIRPRNPRRCYTVREMLALDIEETPV